MFCNLNVIFISFVSEHIAPQCRARTILDFNTGNQVL